ALCLVVLASTGARAEVALAPKLKLSLEERYDEGTLLTADTPVAGQLMTRVSPELGLGLRGRTFVLRGTYAPNLLARHGSGDVTLDHRVRFDLEKRLSRTLLLGADAEALRVSDPISLPRPGFGLPQAPVLYLRAGASAQVAFTRRLQLRGRYGFEEVRVQASGQEPGLLHQPSVELTYLLSRRSTLGVECRTQFFLFGEEQALAPSVGALWDYRLTRTMRLDVRGGPVWFRGADGQSGLAPRLALALTQRGRRSEWSVALGHDLLGASGLEAARWADFASVSGGWSFTRSLRGDAAARYFRNGPAPDLGMLPGTADGRVAQGYALGVGLEWQLNAAFLLRGTLSRIQQVGPGTLTEPGSMTRNIVSIHAVLTAWE
ncbi:MAG: hypothetical protein L0Y66_13080, partial [Myxococcaceae bacterium]|nr:hypothetical protein [Myxococcaceae bacterium]